MVLALSTLCAPSSLEWAELKQVVPSRWQGTSPDMTTLYLQAMDAMHKACNRCSLTALPCLPNSSCTVFDSLNSLCVISGYWPSQASLQLPFAAASESLNAGAAASSGGGGAPCPLRCQLLKQGYQWKCCFIRQRHRHIVVLTDEAFFVRGQHLLGMDSAATDVHTRDFSIRNGPFQMAHPRK